MKQGIKPTRRQKQAIKAIGWDPENWLVAKDTPTEMVLRHRLTNTIKVIPKGA